MAQTEEAQETIPKGYAKDYIFFQTGYETPVSESADLFEAQNPIYGLKYSHRLDSQWVVGLRFQRKPYVKKANDQTFSLLSFTNQTQAIFRLYHPLYFLVGTEISYLYPAQKSSPPPIKDPDLSTEVGVGVNSSLWLLFGPRKVLEFNLVRWRGTKTNRLHGIETTLGLGLGF